MAAAELSDRELRLLRMRSQRLLPGDPEKTVAGAAGAALTIQAQDVPAATLGVRSRTGGLTADSARRQAGRASASRSWLMRNTVFVFATKDLAWMRPLLAQRPLVHGERRLEQLGVRKQADRIFDELPARLAEGPLPRVELRSIVAKLAGDASDVFYWTLHVAALRGLLVGRPALDREQVFVAGPPDEELSREDALGRLAKRYLSAYGPATVDDLAYWAKIPKGDARIGWERKGRAVEVETSLGTMAASAGSAEPPALDGPAVRLLGGWDHFLLGWNKGRELTVPEKGRKAVYPGAGFLRPVAVCDGLAFATWRTERKGAKIEVSIEPFGKLPKGVRPGLEAEAEDVGRFLGAAAKLKIGAG